MKDWEGEKNRYALVTIWEGAVAYALKESMSMGEPPHWLCTNCYQDGKKAILNESVNAKNFHGVTCPVCKSTIQTAYYSLSAAEYAPG